MAKGLDKKKDTKENLKKVLKIKRLQKKKRKINNIVVKTLLFFFLR